MRRRDVSDDEYRWRFHHRHPRIVRYSAEPGDTVAPGWLLLMRGFFERRLAQQMAIEENGRVWRDSRGGWAVVVRPVEPPIKTDRPAIRPPRRRALSPAVNGRAMQRQGT